jgi:Fe-S-cluster containining protein
LGKVRAVDPRQDALPPRGVRRQDLKPGQSLCDACTGKCCRYFSLGINSPVTWDDYDEIRWYLAHGQTIVYVDEGNWYLLVMSACQYLMDDNRCRIYHDRPKVCREYTTDTCEYDSDWSFERLFEAPEQIWEYAEAILPLRRKRPAPPPPPAALVQIGPALR